MAMAMASAEGSPVGSPVLGVVVIGRNEGERLRACLESIDRAAAHVVVARVVYVDSGSTDGSVALAESLGVATVALDMSRPFTAARARNAGFSALQALEPEPHPIAARSDAAPGSCLDARSCAEPASTSAESAQRLTHVQFVDGDCALAPGWLASAAAFLGDRPDVVLVSGRRRERHPERSLFNRLCDLEWDTAPGEASECGGDFLVRAGAFAEVGGFDGGLIAGEEPELCVRLRARGWRIWRLDAEMTAHDANITSLRQWWRRTVRSGHAFAQVARAHRGSDHGIWRKAVARALFWGAGLPALIVAGTLLHPAAALLALIYPVQIARIARRRGAGAGSAWAYGCFTLLGKIPEVVGIATFHANRLRGRSAALIEYK